MKYVVRTLSTLVLGIAIVALLAVLPSAARADALQANGSTDASTAAPVDSGWSPLAGAGLKVFGGLGIVLSVVLFGFQGARRFGPQFLRKKAEDRAMKLVETLSMGEKRSLVLVELGEKRFLLGNTPNTITLLAALRPALVAGADEFELAEARPSGTAGEVAPFRTVLERERRQAAQQSKAIPPDLRAKMRELRANLGR
jgi:flagellar biosynthetic protein FliO